MAKVPISVCIIAKNEEKYLEECLKRLQPFGMEIIVTDTGSTDRTKEIAKKYASKVLDFAWCDDFAAARNFCAEHSSYPWILALDCDEYVSAIDIKTLRILMQKFPKYCGVIRLKNLLKTEDGDITYSTDDVMRFYNRNYYKYYYPIHEQICSKDESRIEENADGFLVPCEIIHHGYMIDEEEMAEKQKRNLNLLYKVVENGKADSYTYFQIGQSELILNHYEEAINAFQQGLELGHSTENVYVHVMIMSLAKAYVYTHQNEKAIEIMEEYVDKCRTAKYMYNYANILLDCKQPLKALMYYIKTISMKDVDTLGEGLKRSYEHIINLYEAMGNQEMADMFQKKYQECVAESERVKNA